MTTLPALTHPNELVTLFVGGFPPRTTESTSQITLDDLLAYFKDVKSLNSVKIVRKGKKSKGYGYLCLRSSQEAELLLKRTHKIFGKMFRVRKMLNKQGLIKDKEAELKRKIFVGGLTQLTNEIMLEAYFAKYGVIQDILVNRFTKSHVSKGCAFILFTEEEVAKSLIAGPQNHVIDDKLVEIRECHKKGTKAREKESNQLQRKKESSREENHITAEASPFIQMIGGLKGINFSHQITNLKFKKFRTIKRNIYGTL